MAVAQINRWWLRSSLILLAASLLLLAISVWSALQMRGHQNRVTGITLTLTRIAHVVADVSAGNTTLSAYSGDQLAQLIAAGDVQIQAIEQAPRTDSQLEPVINGLRAQWQQVRDGFALVNSQVVATTGGLPSRSGVVLQNVIAARAAFDSLFDAILDESLSKSLLALASTIRGDLGSLQYILEHGAQSDAVHSLLGDLTGNVRQLQSVARPQQGAALLGYSASGRLNEFVRAFNTLNAPVLGSAKGLDTARNSNMSVATTSALEYAQGVLRTVDAQMHKHRRNVLVALCLSCLCILFCTAFAWLQKRPLPDTGVDHASTVELLTQDLTHFTDGRLHHSSQIAAANPANKPLADLVNYTGAMIRGLVDVSREVGRNTSELASAQQQLVESLIERDVQTRAQLSAKLTDLRHCADVLHQSTDGHADTESVSMPESVVEPVTGAAAALAGLSAQLEMGIGRIDRAQTLTRELNAVVKKIEETSHQSNLHALNESIKLAGYYDTADESDEFVQKTQLYSRQLQSEAASALQQTRDIHTDLEACTAALRECATALEESARYSLLATQALKDPQQQLTSGCTNRVVVEVVQNLIAVIDQLDISADAGIEQEDLLSVKGYALELQLVAAKLDESLLRFDSTAESDTA